MTIAALLAVVLIIWIAVSTAVIITLTKANVRVQNELKLVNQASTTVTVKATSSSFTEMLETNENIAYAKINTQL